MPRSPLVLGLMSGTSADGVDAVLVEFPGWPELKTGQLPPPPEALPQIHIRAHQQTPYPDDLRARVLAAGRDELTTSALAQLHFELGEVFARAALPLAPQADLIASHGQTVYHIPAPDPARGWTRRATWQLGEAAVIAEQTGRPVVADFRPADLVAGGQAAPLVPFADRLLHGEAGRRRAVHNLGGISNLTYLPGLEAGGVLAFDTGPANALIDEVAGRAGQRYDEGGRLAASGQLHRALLSAWLAHPYFAAPPPKSTGREVWTLERLTVPEGISLPDLAATATALTVQSVADAYRRFVLPLGLDELVVAGGGAYNPVIMDGLRAVLAPVRVQTFEERGWNAAAREAAAFAVLGYHAYQGWPNTLPQTTGARHAVVAGKLTQV